MGKLEIEKLILELSINWNTNVHEDDKRIGIFNYKNKDDFKKFIEKFMINEDLDSLFNDEDNDFEVETQKWLKKVNKIIASSFSKIRIKKEKLLPELENLFSQSGNIITSRILYDQTTGTLF